MEDLETRYFKKVVPQLMQEWGLKNPLAVPRLKKIVVNVGLGEAVTNKKLIDSVGQTLALITGQKPKVTRARISVAGFKLRKGTPIGLMVTLRRKRMYQFLEKLIKIVLPQLRDFQGVSLKSFDGQGNYSLGLPEQTVFPEVDYEKIDKPRGLEITLVTNAGSDQKAKRLLELLGMPFEKKKKWRARVK